MKYIYAILILMLITSFFLGMKLLPTKETKTDIALTINSKTISQSELNDLFNSTSQYYGNRKEFVKSLVNRELLIQKAKKEGIHQEESFRKAIKSYYEQSLVKILMDRKFASFQINVSEDEIDTFKNRFNKSLTLTEFTYSEENQSTEDIVKHVPGKQIQTSFPELSEKMRCLLVLLDESQITAPIRVDDSFSIYRLDMEKEIPTPNHIEPPEREEIETTIREFKTERQVNAWLADLNRKASIKILIEQ